MNSWGIFVFLGIAALSWVFGKMKENAEAEQAKKRAQMHQQRVTGEGDQPTMPGPGPTERISHENPAVQRKQQLAQLRQERLAAMRAEMAARLQTQQVRQTAPARRQQQQSMLRPAIAPQPQPQPQPTRTNVATMRTPPSASRDRTPLVDLGTRREHKPHPSETQSLAHRLTTDAPTTSVDRGRSNAFKVDSMTATDWRRAIILSEILAPPITLREPA